MGRFPCLETLSLGILPEEQIATLMEAFERNPAASARLIELGYWVDTPPLLEIALLALKESLFPNLRKFSFLGLRSLTLPIEVMRYKETKAVEDLEKQREGKLEIVLTYADDDVEDEGDSEDAEDYVSDFEEDSE
jgi:hypothetical protein